MASSIFIWPGVFTVTGGTVIFSGPVQAPYGTAASPGFQFPDGNTGWYGSTGIMRLSLGGSANIMVVTTGQVSFSGDVVAGSYTLANKYATATAPTVTSAGTSPSITASNGSISFRVNVGTGGTATTIVLAMPVATTGWNAYAENITATAANRADGRVVIQSSTTNSLTLQYQTVSTGAAKAFTASDIVSVIAVAF